MNQNIFYYLFTENPIQVLILDNWMNEFYSSIHAPYIVMVKLK